MKENNQIKQGEKTMKMKNIFLSKIIFSLGLSLFLATEGQTKIIYVGEDTQYNNSQKEQKKEEFAEQTEKKIEIETTEKEHKYHNKNGGFFGVSFELNSFILKGSGYGIVTNFTPPNLSNGLQSGGKIQTSIFDSEKISFGGQIQGGYQHYFNIPFLNVKKSLGLRTSAFLGASSPASYTLDYTYDGSQNFIKYSLEYIPINFGADIELLWDFWENEKHTLGISFGVGYSFSYLISNKNENNVVFWNPIENQVFSDLYAHNIYPEIGLHYYYGNNQFSIKYKFGGIMFGKTEAKTYLFLQEQNKYFSFDISQTNYLSIGYSYRF